MKFPVLFLFSLPVHCSSLSLRRFCCQPIFSIRFCNSSFEYVTSVVSAAVSLPLLLSILLLLSDFIVRTEVARSWPFSYSIELLGTMNDDMSSGSLAFFFAVRDVEIVLVCSAVCELLQSSSKFWSSCRKNLQTRNSFSIVYQRASASCFT